MRVLKKKTTMPTRILKLNTYKFALKLIPLLFKLRTIKPHNNSLRELSETKPEVKLDELLRKHGSDKATMHDYWKLYERAFNSSIGAKGIILEVGLGTNNPAIPSNMGGNFSPGGSLEAWKEYFQLFEILGADIDHNILFADDRIQTFWLDQTKRETFSELHQYMSGRSIDFVIVDGLHQPYADLNTLIELLPYLKVGGYLFIEDIEPSRTVAAHWAIVRRLLPRNYSGVLLDQLGGRIFEIQRHA